MSWVLPAILAAFLAAPPTDAEPARKASPQSCLRQGPGGFYKAKGLDFLPCNSRERWADSFRPA